MKQLNYKDAFELAKKYHQKGDIAQAETVYAAVLEIEPHHAGAMHNLGLIYVAKGMLDDGIAAVKKAVEMDRTNAEFHNNLGELYRKKGRLDEAQFHLGAAVDLRPGYSEAYSNLGLVFREKGDINSAKLCFSEALRADPKNLAALINTGNLFRAEDSPEDAIECYIAALEIAPDNATALAGAGLSSYDMGDYNSSAKYYSRLTTQYPEKYADKVNLALITLRNKDFRKGFQLYEARFKYLNVLEGQQDKLWRGMALTGKTLYVYNEKQGLSGFGDTILFARYLPELERFNAAKIIFRVQPQLKELLAANLPSFVEVTSDDCTEFDAHIPLLSLPFVLNARAKTIPLSGGYIMPDAEKAADAAAELSSGKVRIGIAFQTSRKHEKYRERSVNQDAFSSLYKNDKIALYYISKEAPEESLDPSVTDLRGKLNDFADTAAFISALDLVITADTSVAHLAGAMGKKTYLLLNHLHDWRWFAAKTGKQSEWYSSVTFYIKDRSANWADVIESINL